MRVDFVERQSGPERLVCDAEIVFEDEGPLAGMKLVGFGLWRGADGEVYVTVPTRAFGAGTERKFFDYLRSQQGSAEVRLVPGLAERARELLRVRLGAAADERGLRVQDRDPHGAGSSAPGSSRAHAPTASWPSISSTRSLRLRSCPRVSRPRRGASCCSRG